MAAGRADPISRDQHPRTDDNSLRDRIAQRDIDKITAASKTAAQIAHRGEARFDRDPRVGDRHQRELGDIRLQQLQPALIKVAGEIKSDVRVRIHESRRKRGVTEIDHLRAGGNRQVAPRVGDRGSLDNDDTVRDQRLRFAVEEACRLQDAMICTRDQRRELMRLRTKNAQRNPKERREKSKRLLHACGYEIRGHKARSQPRWIER